jgi:hypothetical protein
MRFTPFTSLMMRIAAWRMNAMSKGLRAPAHTSLPGDCSSISVSITAGAIQFADGPLVASSFAESDAARIWNCIFMRYCSMVATPE